MIETPHEHGRWWTSLVITKLPTQPSWKTGQFYFCVITPPAGTKTTAFTTQLMQISRPGKTAFTAFRLKWSHRSHHSLGKVGFRGRHVFHGMKERDNQETYQSVHWIINQTDRIDLKTSNLTSLLLVMVLVKLTILVNKVHFRGHSGVFLPKYAHGSGKDLGKRKFACTSKMSMYMQLSWT